MSRNTSASSSMFQCDINNRIARIHVNSGAFVLGTDLEEKQRLFNTLTDLDVADDVDAVLVFNSADAFTADAHRDYIDWVSGLRTGGHRETAMRMVEREDNALAQSALLSAQYSKILVSCLTGEIASPFFGLSLTSDIRLASPNMHFRLSHVDLGVPPVGGLSYLLPKFVGRGRAAKWLLAGGSIDAEHAQQLGLVTALLSGHDFEEDCVDWVSDVLAAGTDHIKYTRELMYRDIDEFSAHLDMELNRRRRSEISNKTV